MWLYEFLWLWKLTAIQVEVSRASVRFPIIFLRLWWLLVNVARQSLCLAQSQVILMNKNSVSPPFTCIVTFVFTRHWDFGNVCYHSVACPILAWKAPYLDKSTTHVNNASCKLPLYFPTHLPNLHSLSSQGWMLLLLLSRFSRVWLCAIPKTEAHQAPLSLGFSRQEHWSGLPFPAPMHESEKWKGSRSVMSDS